MTGRRGPQAATVRKYEAEITRLNTQAQQLGFSVAADQFGMYTLLDGNGNPVKTSPLGIHLVNFLQGVAYAKGVEIK